MNQRTRRRTLSRFSCLSAEALALVVVFLTLTSVFAYQGPGQPTNVSLNAKRVTLLTYFVDFSAGSDANTGTTSASPWKHAPGDDAATGNAVRTLQPGATVVFKGGVVYSGGSTGPWSAGVPATVRRVIAPNNSGANGNPISYVSGDVSPYNWGTGKAILDGGGPGASAAYSGVGIHGFKNLTIDGLEIRNIGGPWNDASGVDVSTNGAGSADNITVRNCKIHDINWSGAYVPNGRGYGIELNHSSNAVIEDNEIYHTTDKAIEPASGAPADSTNNDANNGIIRRNTIHDTSVHAIVITGNGWQTYDNVFYNIGIPSQDGSTAPNPAWTLKVDHGQGNKTWNNIAYNVNAGFGMLKGYQNEFVQNVVYGVGNQTGGNHGSNDEAALVLELGGQAPNWPAGHLCDSNLYENNLVYYIPAAATTSSTKDIFYNNCGGSNNAFKNNLLYALGGDTTSTGTRIRFFNGAFTYQSVIQFESTFNANFGGSGNVASGNLAGDPLFEGGTLGALIHLPTGFSSSVPNAIGFTITTGSTAIGAALLLASPYDTDIRGTTRTNPWDIGAYKFP